MKITWSIGLVIIENKGKSKKIIMQEEMEEFKDLQDAQFLFCTILDDCDLDPNRTLH